jgi:Zn-dependent protease with chaperone function
MFAARGIAVSFSVFVLVYCTLSLAVSFSWRIVWRRIQHHPVRHIADILFALRMLPWLTACVITAAFTIPSFLLLEPRAIDEPLGGLPLSLGLCGALLGIFGIVNAALALQRASRTISRWASQAEPMPSCGPVPVLRISQPVPAMTTAGIVRPKVLLSTVAEFLLTSNELQTAMNHEIAHVRRRDNLKKLLLRLVTFPRMASLEAAWIEATEMAADDAAVLNAGEALDLAAALLKLSRIRPIVPAIDLTTALVLSPASVMNARIERLIAWSDERLVPSRRSSAWFRLSVALAAIAVCSITYSQSLVRVHAATEWLVR